MSVLSHPSPNFDERRDGAAPSFIILHYTGMKSAKDALARLCDPVAKVSAHYTVDEDGTIYSHVKECARAWHAGQSYWRGITDMNSHSLGIEIVNPGHEWGYRAFPEAQIQVVADLCREIMVRHGIAPENILAHSDIAPSRKEDPGELFPWKMLAEEGVGIWPSDSDEDIIKSAGLDIDRALIDFGYDPASTPDHRLIAFQRHYQPEAFASGSKGQASGATRGRLYGLLAGHWLIPKRGV
jgi:N-acetylmuramoyl-L-alanine amidase